MGEGREAAPQFGHHKRYFFNDDYVYSKTVFFSSSDTIYVFLSHCYFSALSGKKSSGNNWKIKAYIRTFSSIFYSTESESDS